MKLYEDKSVWLKLLKAGDEVIVVGGSLRNPTRTVVKVEGVTKTLIKIGGDKFSREHGGSVPYSYTSPSLEQATEENVLAAQEAREFKNSRFYCMERSEHIRKMNRQQIKILEKAFREIEELGDEN